VFVARFVVVAIDRVELMTWGWVSARYYKDGYPPEETSTLDQNVAIVIWTIEIINLSLQLDSNIYSVSLSLTNKTCIYYYYYYTYFI